LWLILGLCLGVPLLGVVLYGTFLGFEVDAEPGDRERVLTIEDLGYSAEDGEETLSRTRYIDWTSALEYEYEDAGGLYIYCFHSEEHTERDARNVYTGQVAGGSLMIGVLEEGMDLVDSPDAFTWGDQRSSRVITVDGIESGYYLSVRKGKHVFSVAISGLVIEDLDAFLVPAFERAMSQG